MPAELPTMKKLSKHFQIRMTIGMRSKLLGAAKKNKVSLAEYIRIVLQKHLDRFK